MPTTTIDPSTGAAQASDDTRHLFSLDTDGSNYSASLDNVPADFDNATAVTWQVEYRASGQVDDTLILRVRIMNGSTVLAAADSGGTYVQVASGSALPTTDTVVGPTAFAYVNTAATAADWNGASVELQQGVSRSMGGDGCRLEVDHVTFDVTYNALVFDAFDTFIDDFNDNSFDTTLWDNISSGILPQVDEVNQRLELECLDDLDIAAVRSVDWYDLDESEIKWSLETAGGIWPQSSQANSTLLALDSSWTSSVGRIGSLFTATMTGESLSGQTPTAGADNIIQARWRIASGTMYIEVTANGTSWETLWSFTAPTETRAKFRIQTFFVSGEAES